MSGDAVGRLVEEGVIAPVEPDPETAANELGSARAHLETAAHALRRDPNGAFALGYDALRKAVTAHMRARGYRTTSRPGQHARIVRYAVAALGDRMDRHVTAMDELRLLRNQSQYDGVDVAPDEVEELLVHARAIVAAVGEELGP